MGLFSFGKKGARIIALIDIGSSSVGGAYVHLVEGEKPVIYYTARVDVEARYEESLRDSMLRSLAFLERLLVEEGAPALRRETGSARIDSILVSISAPWQESVVTSTHIEEEKRFTFSRKHTTDATLAAPEVPKDRVRSEQSIIATILNGYETTHPYGKRVSRAEIVMLSSSLEKETAHLVETSLRKAFHSHTLQITAFAPIAYSVFRDLYPHQKDFIVLDVSGAGTDIIMVKQGLLSDVIAVPVGTRELCSAVRSAGIRAHEDGTAIIRKPTNTEFDKECERIQKEWIRSLHTAFSSFSKKQALPRTVFLLADTDVRAYIKRILDESELKSLWLTDDPLSIVAIEPSHLTPSIKTRGQGTGDLYLALLALYCGATSKK